MNTAVPHPYGDNVTVILGFDQRPGRVPPDSGPRVPPPKKSSKPAGLSPHMARERIEIVAMDDHWVWHAASRTPDGGSHGPFRNAYLVGTLMKFILSVAQQLHDRRGRATILWLRPAGCRTPDPAYSPRRGQHQMA